MDNLKPIGELNENELWDLIWSGDNVDIGENRRWSQSVTTVFEYGDKTYMITWERGLTENQENYLDVSDVQEVKKLVSVNATVNTQWVPIDFELKNIEMKQNIDSLKLVADENIVNKELEVIKKMKLDETIKSIESLEALMSFDNMSVEAQVAVQFLNKLKTMI